MTRGIVRRALRSAAVAAMTMLAAVCLAVAGTATTAVTLTATALIVPGTGTPDPTAVEDYMSNAVAYYIAPTTASCAQRCTPEPVPYIAQFWPFPFAGWGGLSGAKLDASVASGVEQLTSDLIGTYRPGPADPVVIFGYSQGATVASLQKSLLSKLSADDQANISFVLIGNPNRPNGGLFARLAAFGTVPILDATFGLPTPTDTAMATVDVAFQYDGTADFPLYPINLLATLNAAAGFWYNHGTMLSPDGRHPTDLPNGLTPAELAAAIADPANQQRVAGSDTTYVLIPTPDLPLLQPLREFGASFGLESLTTAVIDLVQPALRVLIETGYDRTLPYGQPAPLRLIPPVNPVTLTVDLVDAIGQGIRDALDDLDDLRTAPPAGPAVGATAGAVAQAGEPPPSSTRRPADQVRPGAPSALRATTAPSHRPDRRTARAVAAHAA